MDISLNNIILDEAACARYEDLAAGTYVMLAVRDTGKGIDPQVINRIFDPYFTTKDLGEGTGMGLAVIHGIVKAHNGAIRVESNPGQGTVFKVLFPLIDAEPEPEADAPAALRGGTERILFVDDEDSIVRVQKKNLAQLGYDVVAKTDSLDALEVFKASPDEFDLIITDMTMPNMTGDKLASKILGIRPDMPIIICSGFSAKIDDNKAQTLGIRRYVEKPCAISDFAEAIRSVLDEKKGKILRLHP